MATVQIPQPLRVYTRDQAIVTAEGKNVRQLINALESAYPGLKNALMEDEKLKADVALAVDGKFTRLGLLQPLTENSEVIFIPSIVGG